MLFPNFQQVDVARANREAQGYSQNAAANYMNTFKLGQDMQQAERQNNARPAMTNAVAAFLAKDDNAFNAATAEVAKYDPAQGFNLISAGQERKKQEADVLNSELIRREKLLKMGMDYIKERAPKIPDYMYPEYRATMVAKFGPEAASILPEKFDAAYLAKIGDVKHEKIGDNLLELLPDGTTRVVYSAPQQPLSNAGKTQRDVSGGWLTQAQADAAMQRGSRGVNNSDNDGFGFKGNSLDAQAYSIVFTPNADITSPQYAMAYTHLTQPKLVPGPNGTMVSVTPTLPPNIRPPANWGSPQSSPTQTPQSTGTNYTPSFTAGSALKGAGSGSFTNENSLRDEFTANTKDFRIIQDAHSKISTAAASNTGPGDMSMLYQFVKLLDPNSVVRESEFETAGRSGSLDQRVQGYFEAIKNGTRMPPEMKANFLREAGNILAAQTRSYDKIAENYRNMAIRYGLDPKSIVVDYRVDNNAQKSGESGANSRKPMAGLTIGEVHDGHKYLGGDPNDKSSWEKN